MLISFCFLRSEIDMICCLVSCLYTDHNFIITCFSNTYVEHGLHQRCVEEFELAALQKDDNITPDLMIECCDQLFRHKNLLSPLLKIVHLWITNYYSILSGGEMCVPWYWKL